MALDGAPRRHTEEFENVFRQAVESGKPWVIECAIDKDAMVHPMVPGGANVTNFLLD